MRTQWGSSPTYRLRRLLATLVELGLDGDPIEALDDSGAETSGWPRARRRSAIRREPSMSVCTHARDQHERLVDLIRCRASIEGALGVGARSLHVKGARGHADGQADQRGRLLVEGSPSSPDFSSSSFGSEVSEQDLVIPHVSSLCELCRVLGEPGAQRPLVDLGGRHGPVLRLDDVNGPRTL
jgi:hypothetical protein